MKMNKTMPAPADFALLSSVFTEQGHEWPENCTHARLDNDGEICFAPHTEHDFYLPDHMSPFVEFALHDRNPDLSPSVLNTGRPYHRDELIGKAK